MNFQSKSFDPVLGMHVHMLVYPAPPTGVVILPGIVLSVGLVMPDLAGAVVGAVRGLIGFPAPDASVLVHGCKATATGSDITMVHAQPIGGPLSPTEDVVGDTALYFGSRDVLIGPDAKYAVRLAETALGCAFVGRMSSDLLITLDFDVLSGREPSFDAGTFAADLLDFAVGELAEVAGGGSEVLGAVAEVIWNSHEEILAFVENPTPENAAALAEKLGEEAIDAAVDAALEAVLGAVLGATGVKATMRETARRGTARARRPRPRGLRPRGSSAR